MPNHVRTIINFVGKDENIQSVLALIRGENTCIDFNKIIPMPESLNIEDGSNTYQGINLYLTYVKPDVSYFGADEDKWAPEMFTRINTLLTIERLFGAYKIMSEEEVKEFKAKPDFEQTFNLGKTAVENMINYGATTWYKWRCMVWGTKWNSYDTCLDGHNLSMSTAWSCPIGVLQGLAEICAKYDVEFEGKWADEDMGNNTGHFKSCAGAICSIECPACSSSAYKTYAECWGNELCFDEDDEGNIILYSCEDCPNADKCR